MKFAPLAEGSGATTLRGMHAAELPWDSGPVAPDLPADEVHVWRLPLARPADDLSRLTACLTADERARAARFRHEAHRRRFVVARVSLRAVLASYLGRAAADVR